MTLKINENILSADITSPYRIDNRVKIHSFWQHDEAMAISQALAKETKFLNAHFIEGQNKQISDGDFAKLNTQERTELQQKIYSNAADGVGFLYGRHQIAPNPQNTEIPELLLSVGDALNTDEMLTKIRSITGHKDICAASAQATRYIPGNFLTRHNDIHQTEQRRVAYVLGFSPKWHPDWGGLLQFYHDNGTPKDAWAPDFNSMTLFDVRHVHAVTFVTPFAPLPRLSVTGWFRATPL